MIISSEEKRNNHIIIRQTYSEIQLYRTRQIISIIHFHYFQIINNGVQDISVSATDVFYFKYFLVFGGKTLFN